MAAIRSINVPAKGTRTPTVAEQRVYRKSVSILPMDVDQLPACSKTGEISAEVRQALHKAAEIKQAMAQTRQAIEQHRQQIAQGSRPAAGEPDAPPHLAS